MANSARTKSPIVALGEGCLSVFLVCFILVIIGAIWSGTGNDSNLSQPTGHSNSNANHSTGFVRLQLPDTIDAAGVGLRGILAAEIPLGLKSDAFLPLGDSWSDWSANTQEQIGQLYQDLSLDVAEQQSVLDELRKKLDTMETAMADPDYRSIRESLALVHARLKRRVIMSETVLAVLEANDRSNYEAQLSAADRSTVEALNDLEQWLLDDVNGGSAWLGFLKVGTLRNPTSGSAETEVLRDVLGKLSDPDRLDDDSQRQFIQKPKFAKLKKCVQRQIRLLEFETSDGDESLIRTSLARLVYAVELWEQHRSPNSRSLIETAFKQCEGEIRDTVLLGDALSQTYLVTNLMTQPTKVCEAISGKVGFDVGWRESRVVDGEWVTSPTGPSVEFGRSGYSIRPNLFFYVTGSQQREVQRITLKLNLNASPDHDEARNRLIESMNSLLEIDGRSLPQGLVNQIRSIESVSNPRAEQSDAMLLSAHRYDDYILELLYETGRYTAILLRLVHPDPTPTAKHTAAPDRSNWNKTTESRPSNSRSNEIDYRVSANALSAAQLYVKKHFNNLDVANWKWPGIFDGRDDIKSSGHRKYRVKSWVDVENVLGGMTRIHYDCEVETDGDDGWRVNTFTVIE